MGKDKGRIKGNAQPADSSKAAQFLQSSGPIGFGSFGGSPTGSSSSLTGTGFGGGADEYAAVEPELKVLLKKLSKRDSITKAKAIDEILAMLKGNTALLDSFMPVWDSLFNKLALDVDRKVRENTLAIHLHLAQTESKRLAPILKKIIGTWLAARFDVSKEVSSLAFESFKASFSQKQEQVLVFCQAEILAYLSNNIMEQTVQSMSDARYTAPEDMVSKYARTVAASFDTLSFVIENVSSKNRESQVESYTSLFTDKRFWIHSCHEQPLIRSSVYRLIKTCVQNAPEAIELSLDNLAQHFLSKCFAEKEYDCYNYMWDAVLLLLKHHPAVWTKASEKKPVINKLYFSLSESIYGSGKVSYPCILPLIAHLPPDVCDETFFTQFFVHFWKGVDKIDRFTGQVFINSYFECCKYLIKSSKSLLIKDFLRPIETLLTGKLSKIPHDVVIEHFALYFSHISNSLEPSVLLDFEEALLGIFRNALDSAASVTLLCSFLNQIWITRKEESIPNTILTKFLPTALSKFEKGSAEGNQLLLTIFSADLDYSDEVVQQLCQFARKALETDVTALEVEVVLRLLFIIQKSDLEQSRSLWPLLIAKMVAKDSTSFSTYFAAIISSLKMGAPAFITPSQELESALNDQLSSASSSLDTLLASLLTIDSSVHILNRPTMQLAIEFIDRALDLLTEALLVIRKKEVVSFENQVFLEGVASLNAIKLVVEEAIVPKESLVAISSVFYAVLELSICDPTAVATFKWSSNSISLNVVDSIKSIREASKAIVVQFSSKCESVVSTGLATKWGQEWNKSFSNLDHCASPLDFLDEVKGLLKLSADKDYHSAIWVEIIQTPEYWKTMSTPYYTKHSPSMSIADPLLIWTVLRHNAELESAEANIIYDRDGLSNYSRRSLLIMGLLKDESIQSPSMEFWLTHELLRFKFVCADSVFKEAPFPFLDDCISHASRIDKDVADLFSRLSINQSFQVSSILSACQTNPIQLKSDASCSLDFSFLQAVEESSSVSAITSDCRIFGFLIGKCPLDTIDSSSLSAALSNLLKNKQYSLLSAFLLFLLPSTNLEATVFSVFGKALIRKITSAKPQSETLSEEVSSTVVLNHLLQSFKGDLTGLLSAQERTALFRWIRTYYDAKLVDEPTSRNGDGGFSVMFDAIVCNLLVLLLRDVNAQEADIGLNMANFVANLNLFWFKQIAASSISQEIACLLFHVCKSWQELQEAADNDADSWQRVIDVEDDVEELVLELFITASQPDMLSTAGFAVLQELMADIVGEYSHSDFLRILVVQEQMIYNMFFTRNEQVQKTAYILARTITAKRVQDVSVALEMQTAEQNPVFLKAALVSGLQRGFGVNEEDRFGCLLSWLCAVDHFVDATFDLRQYYTNHIRDLNVLGPFLESIFDLLNVDSRKGETFNLALWEFEEYMVEGFDSSSETSIPLLGAHLYYRLLKSLPVLVRLWFSECKNRQLVLAVENFTERYFSPLIAAAEFKTVQKLIDDDMSIKINPMTFDISATYSFEEAELDIIIKLPSCFPLKLVEVSSGSGGGRQAGISDARWRGWLLAVSSIMIGHNGSVADSLAQFKKNVSLHFEGIEDCAICYSVISLADRSTPQKACRVCKHVFHGSCLYKWFKSSSQNTCPLCRQPI